MAVLYVLSSLGGAAAFFIALYTIVKTVVGQVNSTRDNTDAINALNESVKELKKSVDINKEDIAYIKGKVS
jgi:hypothetical protein